MIRETMGSGIFCSAMRNSSVWMFQMAFSRSDMVLVATQRFLVEGGRMFVLQCSGDDLRHWEDQFVFFEWNKYDDNLSKGD